MKLNIHTYMILLLLLLGLIINCDKSPTDHQYQKEIMVFGFLHANESLSREHAISISYTQPVIEFYDPNTAGIHNAVVTLTEGETVSILQDTNTKPGFYFNDNLIIKPDTEYHLRIEAEGQIVTATTTVPAILEITTDLEPDTMNPVYPKNLGYEKPIYLKYDNPDQIILTEIYCNEHYSTAEYINPFNDHHKFPENPEEYDQGQNAEPRRIYAPVAYRDLAAPLYDNQHVIFWYASMIVFYGSNTLQVIAIDDNYHHYLLREKPLYNGGIRGGLGVFGSVSGETYALNILKE